MTSTSPTALPDNRPAGAVAGSGRIPAPDPSNPAGNVLAAPGLAFPAGPEPRTWTIEMPAGMKLLNANQRPHWAAKGRIVAALRLAGFACAKNAHIPPLSLVRIVVEYQPPRKIRTRDGGNWAPTGKALIDGIRDAKILPDDDSSHVAEEAYRIGAPYPLGRMVVHITEVTP
jgi:crossover junction endodeoxyribonuclease RusA